ncbi:MAG: hypothetical protein QNJ40_20730 [Xanthomonadales bacterium]|nr:hypothetical protein [Xanthomonadales bacterium]
MPEKLIGLLAALVLGGCAVTVDTPTELANRIRWSTASEVENFGYDVYRGPTEDGPFVRLTTQPVAGAGTTDEEQQYLFVDDTIDEGQAYYYYVESISLSGERERFTPVFRSKAKFRQ